MLCEMLASLSARERANLVGMVPGREDVILGGALVLDVVVARYRCHEVIVSERDILDGIVLSIL
jgi:exopolyphosphatase/guanosine-5'-triphosphate,3'-diphosphate pyrophosphatase